MKNLLHFKYLVLLSAIGLAGIAGFFSISGISQLFTGASLATAIMAGALELAKLVSASFVYRRWYTISKMLRAYLVLGIIALSCITSSGIFGYLTSAYAAGAKDIQATENQLLLYANEIQQNDQTIMRLTTRQQQLQNGRGQQENRLDSLIQKGRSINTQQAIIKSQDTELQSLQIQITSLSHQKDSLVILSTTTKTSMTSTSKLGTFYYFAQTLGVPLDKIVRIFTLILVCVFDPLSIALFLAYNFMVLEQIEESSEPLMPVRQPKASNDRIEPARAIIEAVIDDAAPVDSPLVTPYYLERDFDWKTDSRWHNDSAAKAYYQQLGMH